MSKGPVLQTLERVEKTLVDKSVGQYRGLMDAQGDDKYGSVSLTRSEENDRWLGLWFILGQADDLVSLAWWQKLATTQPVHEVADLDLRARTSWADHETREAALSVVGDDLQRTYTWLRQVGWHSGQPRPRADAGGSGYQARHNGQQRPAPVNGGY